MEDESQGFEGMLKSAYANDSPFSDAHPEVELPKIMASLGLNENVSPTFIEEKDASFSADNSHLRRSKRKQAVPRILSGGVVKRRCTLRLSRQEALNHESEDEIREFYKNYNKNYKAPSNKNLETIYEEPRERNGTITYSGPKRRRSLSFSNTCVTKAKLRKRQYASSRIREMLLQEYKSQRGHFTIEDVKDRLAQSGTLP